MPLCQAILTAYEYVEMVSERPYVPHDAAAETAPETVSEVHRQFGCIVTVSQFFDGRARLRPGLDGRSTGLQDHVPRGYHRPAPNIAQRRRPGPVLPNCSQNKGAQAEKPVTGNSGDRLFNCEYLRWAILGSNQ
ncbi:hypothetical protein FHG89_08405 [Micromonospora orduensis]|uniref:Uncharacterized protein n=1 Tax=Micromonospora orduensis TaxID=1420891 RepID=A0A5C4QWD3_9ACTN|nr:hypothetical protein [Micromonospora orduensis]TNH30264.1 hypothetical protein FHG89_08405 [Micromonospora orduensis]